MAASKSGFSSPTVMMVRFIGASCVTLIAGVFLWNILAPKQKITAPSVIEKQENQPEADASAPDPAGIGKGLSEMMNDIVENAPKETTEGTKVQRIPTKDGTFVFDAPAGFTQGVDEVHHSYAFYLSNKQGQRNEHVVMMFVAPVETGPKGNGLYLITAAAKRGILNGGLGIGTNYEQMGKVTVESWQSVRRGSFAYAFDSRVSSGRQQGMDMFIYRTDSSTGGLWVHIQMPVAAWKEVYPHLSASLDTLLVE